MDIFAFGLILFEAATFQTPYALSDILDKPDFDSVLPPLYPPRSKAFTLLLQSMLSLKPDSRALIGEVIELLRRWRLDDPRSREGPLDTLSDSASLHPTDPAEQGQHAVHERSARSIWGDAINKLSPTDFIPENHDVAFVDVDLGCPPGISRSQIEREWIDFRHHIQASPQTIGDHMSRPRPLAPHGPQKVFDFDTVDPDPMSLSASSSLPAIVPAPHAHGGGIRPTAVGATRPPQVEEEVVIHAQYPAHGYSQKPAPSSSETTGEPSGIVISKEEPAPDHEFNNHPSQS
jgi:serine/threonine protein kinase